MYLSISALMALLPLLPSLTLANPVPPPPNSAVLRSMTSHPHPLLFNLKRDNIAVTPAQLQAIDKALSAGHLGTSFADFAKKTGLDLKTVERIFGVTGLVSAVSSSSTRSVSTVKQSSSSSKSTGGASLSTSSAKTGVSSSTSKVITSSPTSKPAQSSSTSKSATTSSSSIAKSQSVTSGTTSTTLKGTSSVATPSPSTSSGDLTADQQQFLTLHNQFRAKYGAAPFTWNSTLATYAANTASTCKYGHTYGPYGENIAAGVGGGYNIAKGFDTWAANEAVKYNYSNPGYSEATGHFTQIVWKNSTQVGCAAQSCADGTIFTGYGQNSLYLVCEFLPPGNWVSSNADMTKRYFSDNVGRPV